jgi:hypothetical protein
VGLRCDAGRREDVGVAQRLAWGALVVLQRLQGVRAGDDEAGRGELRRRRRRRGSDVRVCGGEGELQRSKEVGEMHS